MYSIIEKCIPNELMSFKHIGEIKSGIEQPLDEKTKLWDSALETYILIQNDKNTKLIISLNMFEEYTDYFNDTFPKAISENKRIAES